LYEASEGKHYPMAFFTFFIPVSLFDLEIPFLRSRWLQNKTKQSIAQQ